MGVGPLKAHPSIKTIILRECELTDPCCEYLADLVSENNVIETLDLQKNRITSAGAGKIADNLLKNRSLHTLDLKGRQSSQFGDKCLAHFIQMYETDKGTGAHEAGTQGSAKARAKACIKVGQSWYTGASTESKGTRKTKAGSLLDDAESKGARKTKAGSLCKGVCGIKPRAKAGIKAGTNAAINTRTRAHNRARVGTDARCQLPRRRPHQKMQVHQQWMKQVCISLVVIPMRCSPMTCRNSPINVRCRKTKERLKNDRG